MSHRTHIPTRVCPHRWCLPLHAAMSVLALIAMIVLLTKGDTGASASNISVFWLISIVIGIAGYAVSRAVLGHSSGQLAKLDRLDRIRGIVLIVRPGWAIAAIVSDAMFVALAGAAGAFALAGQTGASQMSYVNQGDILFGMAVTLTLTGFRDFAHHMATKPVKPKRVLVPASGLGQSA